MKSTDMPPGLTETDRVILFDGVCKLCNAWISFIIKVDTNHYFKLCSVQSKEGKAILEHFDFPVDSYETMLYVEGNTFLDKTSAFFKVMGFLAYPWRALGVLRIFPLLFRNWCYDRIALNRYKLFGKYKQCKLPTADHSNRFLGE
ncbi:MAG: putative DCC family thiol-disulfide oxidoreductase YuxK [Bermanella sp.]|jgi:predicted DCC family thiol-disulfide oxidoreductase YuxK